ncbi:hypothetical protein N665_1141s0003 [Sinapis alba]|nr:hypothetical protein N665_1141s0003 [Sinapis alba]
MRNFCCVAKTSSNHQPPLTLTPRQSLESAAVYGIIESAADIIERWNTETSTYAKVTSLFHENKQEAMLFIDRVKDLQKTMDLLVSEDPNSERLVRAQRLMEIAMKRLQKEFYQILSMNRAYLDPESVSTRSSLTSERSSYSDFPEDEDSYIEVEEASSNVMTELRSIAECMIVSGYAKECISIYKSIRKSIIDEGVYRLEVEKVKRMSWEEMELKVRSWLEAVKVSMETLFKGEKILCDHVFESSDSIRESCFNEISREGAILLFSFPVIIALRTSKKNPPPEIIFRLLDMYSSVAGNWRAIESTFSFESTSVVRSQAVKSLISLSESIRSLLLDFESRIHKDSSKVVVHGGGVHPLTLSVVNHISLLANYSNVLVDILAGSPPPDISLIPETYFNVSDSDDSPSSELTIRFAWLILVLLCKIDRKANYYKDSCSVQYLFLTNNLHHVVSRARSSNLKQLLGDDWVKRHVGKIKQFSDSYKRLAWGPVLATLPENRTVEMSAEEVKERFEKFSEGFERAYGKQSACVVPDTELRDEIKLSIARKLVPVYREFYNTRRGGYFGEFICLFSFVLSVTAINILK